MDALVDAGFRSVVTPLQEELVRGVRPALYLLWGGAILVLLIGGVNLATLLTIRASGRSREMAIRQAMGARLSRLSRKLVTETTLLTAVGGSAGAVVGWWFIKSVSALHLEVLPRGNEIRLDPSSILLMIGLAIVVGLLGSLTPLAQLARLNLSDTIRDGGRGACRSNCCAG